MSDDRLPEGHGLARVANLGGDRGGLVPPRSPSRLPVDEDIVHADLQLVVALAAVSVPGAAGVSLALARGGVLRTVATSNGALATMDAVQEHLGQGPSLTAVAEGRRVHVPSIGEEERWPELSARATELGVRAILATPVAGQARAAGALTFYSSVPRSFGGTERTLASLFALQASVILQAQDDGDVSSQALTSGLRRDLEERETQALAQGILTWTSSEGSERYRIWGEEDQAIERAFSPPGETHLRDRARHLLESSRLQGRRVGRVTERRSEG